MIAEVRFTWREPSVWDSMTQDEWLLFADGFGWKDPGEKPNWSHNGPEGFGGNHVVDLQILAPIADRLGIELDVVGFPGSYALHGNSDAATLRQRLHKVHGGEAAKIAVEAASGDAVVVQVAIPDLALLAINEVTWMENACTEQLQKMLVDGWRILAVCPPNAQRRPDYILGRKSNGDGGKSANPF